MLRIATALLALALLAIPSAHAQDVGTAAAVNPSTQGTPPGGAIRTIALGDNIIHNERVATDGAGLLQILFVDGTTLTMGPNSELVIDSFFYDPNANTAQVAVTMTKGVLRFIGGLTSKTPDGATIGTPIGTIGIRGGIVDVDLNANDGTPQHIDMLFGNEVTLEKGLELLGRLFKSGYSLVFGPDGAIGVQKTPPEWSAQMRAALAGKPGTSGGSGNQPDDGTVADSGVPDSNSGTGLDGDDTPLTDEEIEQLLLAAATYDELRRFIFTPPPDDDEEEPQPFTLMGASGGMLTTQFDDVEYGPGYAYTRGVITTGETLGDGILTSIDFDAQGNPTGGTIDVADVTECVDCRYTMTLGPGGSSIVVNQGTESEYSLQNASVGVTGHDGVPLPGGITACTCAFMKWGFWDAHGEEIGDNGTQYHDLSGTWVAGNITTPDELTGLATTGVTASYSGHAVGYASDNGDTPHLAAGSIFMGWSFADRSGELSIDNFDGSHSLELSMSGDPATGFIYGDYGGPGVQAVARGAFANNGTQPAAGLGGDFHWSEYYEDESSWEAAGIFIGQQVPN